MRIRNPAAAFFLGVVAFGLYPPFVAREADGDGVEIARVVVVAFAAFAAAERVDMPRRSGPHR